MQAKNDLISKILRDFDLCMADIEADAHFLQDSFYEARLELQEKAQRLANEEAIATGKPARMIFCSLHLSVRMLNGALQLYWNTLNVSPTNKIKIRKYLPRNKQGVQDLRSLKKHAHELEWGLVQATEKNAKQIRDNWRATTSVRASVLRLKKKIKATNPISATVDYTP